MTAPRFGLIVFGDELLSGKRQDAHAPKFIELLAARGLPLDWARYVRDDRAAQAAALRAAARQRATQCSAAAASAPPPTTTRARLRRWPWALPLQPHAEAQQLIRERVAEMARERGEPPPDEAQPDMRRRLEMGVLPAGCRLIPNPYNRIAGFSVGRLHFVPGFPVMAHPMMAWVLDERVRPG
jgi:molybdopterin-biosynthesis enzyme MoeA-like protein